MKKKIQILEDGRVPAKETQNWKMEGQKKKTHEERVSQAFV